MFPTTARASVAPSSSRAVASRTAASTGRISHSPTGRQSSHGRNAVWLTQGASASGPSIARRISAKLISSGGRARL